MGEAVERIPAREEVDPAFAWDLALIYPSPSAWEVDFENIEAAVTPLENLQGRLSTAESLREMFSGETELNRLIGKLYIYAHLKADEDTANAGNQARLARIRTRAALIAARLAWVVPEILANSDSTLQSWMDDDSLKEWRYALQKIVRKKPHVLSQEEETLLSGATEVFAAPYQTYNFLANADLKFPDITDEKGNSRELSDGRYARFLLNRDRRVRREAFESLFDTYGQFENTLASTLSATVKVHNYMARIRHYDSALAAALDDDPIPISLYESLIEATHEALPVFFEYVDLRRQRLEIDRLDMYDFHVPIIPEIDINVPFEQAREWVMASCSPLGDDYGTALAKAFDEKWIDVYENRGKQSGAYSSGSYDTPPYVLLNYQGTLNDVFTLAHELGHAMHSWLSNKHQPPQYARYTIFVAEIASTLNERLLLDYLMESQEDPTFRAYLMNHLCDGFKGTVYRQTMFAEFERMIHNLDAEGTPLTAETLSGEYETLNRTYYGSGVNPDDRIALEWARIPHFYYNFYVYKYATSFCASQVFARQVHESPEGRDRYLRLLCSGAHDDPLELVKRAGVDLTDRQTLISAFEAFGKAIKSLDGVLTETQ